MMEPKIDGYRILNEIASVVSQSLDINEILSSALDKVLQATGLNTGGIYLLNPKTRELSISCQKGFKPEFISEIDNLQVGEGFSGQVIEDGKPLVIKDMSQDSRLSRGIALDEGLSSLAVVPLCSKGKTLGTLFLASRDPKDFVEDEIQLLISAGQQILPDSKLEWLLIMPPYFKQNSAGLNNSGSSARWGVRSPPLWISIRSWIRWCT